MVPDGRRLQPQRTAGEGERRVAKGRELQVRPSGERLSQQDSGGSDADMVFSLCVLISTAADAQSGSKATPAGSPVHTVRVDASRDRAVHSFRPQRALGAGVDRLSTSATEKLFAAAFLERILEAGWQTVSYRQNTELHVEAWHWNPQGTWSDPAGRGYFTGNAVARRAHPPLVRLPPAAPWGHAQRRHRLRLLAADRRRPGDVLEEQSLPDATPSPAKRTRPIPSGWSSTSPRPRP